MLRLQKRVPLLLLHVNDRRSHSFITVEAGTLSKCVLIGDIFTALYVVILVSHFTPSHLLSSAAMKPCCVQIKAANSTSGVLTRCFTSPCSPMVLCDVPFHWRRTVTLEIRAPYVLSLGFEHGVFGMLRISPMISNYPPLTDCLVSLAVCWLDMMILPLQCKRIVA